MAGKCATDPDVITRTIRQHAPRLVRAGLETGLLSNFLTRALRARGVPVVCLDARHAKAALRMQINKTDANDAHGLERFRQSSTVGAYLGLTPRRYQSGDVDCAGHISKCGDGLLRSYLFQAANAILTRKVTDSTLRSWGRASAARIGLRRSTVAVAENRRHHACRLEKRSRL